MSQHTPGPWKAGNVNNIGHGFLIWSEGNGCDVATVKVEQDRHLIAAAPAMLAALQKINAICAPGESDPERMAAMLSEIAAIAAATGTPTGEGGHPIPVVQQGEGGQ